MIDPIQFREIVNKIEKAKSQEPNITDIAIKKHISDFLFKLDPMLVRIQDDVKLSLPSFKKNCQDFIQNVIRVAMGFIDSEGGNKGEKTSGKAWLQIFEDHLSELIKLYDDSLILDTVPDRKEKQENRLALEQRRVEKVLSRDLEHVLIKIDQGAKKFGWQTGKCFISYAWAHPLCPQDVWVQGFLKNLRNQLRMAGILAKIDIVDNAPGKSIYNYMQEELESSSNIIIIGNSSLHLKHQKGVSAVCNELSIILKQREKKSDLKVIPVLLADSFDDTFPDYFKMYTQILDWNVFSYLTNLKELIRAIYNLEADVANYNKIWIDLELQHPNCLNMLSEAELAILHAEHEKQGNALAKDPIQLNRSHDVKEHAEQVLKHADAAFESLSSENFPIVDERLQVAINPMFDKSRSLVGERAFRDPIESSPAAEAQGSDAIIEGVLAAEDLVANSIGGQAKIKHSVTKGSAVSVAIGSNVSPHAAQGLATIMSAIYKRK